MIVATNYEELELDQGYQDVLAVKLSGTISGEDMKLFNDRLDEIIAQEDKARVYIDLTDYEGFDASMVVEKFSHLGAYWVGIRKLAYIVNREWMQNAIGFVDTLTPMHMRAFTHDQVDIAQQWLLSNV